MEELELDCVTLSWMKDTHKPKTLAWVNNGEVILMVGDKDRMFPQIPRAPYNSKFFSIRPSKKWKDSEGVCSLISFVLLILFRKTTTKPKSPKTCGFICWLPACPLMMKEGFPLFWI